MREYSHIYPIGRWFLIGWVAEWSNAYVLLYLIISTVPKY